MPLYMCAFISLYDSLYGSLCNPIPFLCPLMHPFVRYSGPLGHFHPWIPAQGLYGIHFFNRQLDFSSETGSANEVLENEPQSCLAVA